MKHYFIPILTASMLLSMGCEASEEPDSPAQDFAGSSGDSEGSTLASFCPLANQTRSCFCGQSSGRQTCVGSQWTDCECFFPDGGPVVDQGGQLAGDLSTVAPEGNRRGDLKFDWMRTPPAGGSCVPGHYEGTFECDLDDGTNSWGKVTGPVTIVLERSEINGEYLVIADGNMVGYAEQWVSPISAKLEGRLDCTTSEFEATTVDGHYLMLSFFDGPFNGVLEGNYNRLTWQLAGEWHLIDDFHVGFNCLGPWHVDYVGP